MTEIPGWIRYRDSRYEERVAHNAEYARFKTGPKAEWLDYMDLMGEVEDVFTELNVRTGVVWDLDG